LGQIKDAPMEVILPQGYGDIDKIIVIYKGWFCYMSQGRSRDMNVVENG
jgi:hypothetical protein